MSWSDLPMSSRSELMSIYLKNGITSLDEMKKHYNSFAEGGSINDPPYTQFLNTLPDNLKNSGDEYNMRRYWELNGYPKDFNEGIQKGMFTKQDDGYHANSVAFNPITNSYEFMKDRSHPTYNMELDWYYSDDPEAVDFRKNYRYTPGIGMIPDQYTPKRFDTGGPIDPERFFGIATPEVTDNNIYQSRIGMLPEVKINTERPSWQHSLTDYDLARLRSGQISPETAKSIAQKRTTGTSGFMEDLNRLSNPMHEGLSGYRKFMNEHPSLEFAYDAASAGLSGFPFTAPIGYTMAGVDLLSGIDDMVYNGPAFDNIIDVLGVMPTTKYSKTIKGVEGARKGLRYRRGIPDITINPIGTPILLGEVLSDMIDAKNVGEGKINNAEPYATGGKIFIKPENRGKFTALKKRTGHSASWFKENGTPAQRKMAVFELNSRKWKH